MPKVFSLVRSFLNFVLQLLYFLLSLGDGISLCLYFLLQAFIVILLDV